MFDALVGHLVGDFLFQNDWQALNKKKSTYHCLVHVTIWTFSVMLFTGWWSIPVFLWLFATHFAIDRTQFISKWMEFMGQKSFRDNLAPWSSIVVDQVFHILTLWIVYILV